MTASADQAGAARWPRTLETARLILRPWRTGDADLAFPYMHDPEVGPRAGWPVHRSVEESRQIVRDVLAVPETYAITLKRLAPLDLPIGAIGLNPAERSDVAGPGEAEVGYWIGRPFWGHGIVPEATVEIIRHAFEDLGLSAVWCAYYEGNEQSHRVAQKAGFQPHHVVRDAPRPLLGDTKTEYVTRLTRAEWELGQEKDPTDAATRTAQQAERARIERAMGGIAYIRAGGQTGADRGALDAARAAGAPICGWCPAGGLAEDMPQAPGLLLPYPELKPTPSAGYMQRTAWNVRDAHATLVVSPDGVEPNSGTSATVDLARAYGRPVFIADRLDDVPAIRAWLAGIGRDLTLNVAGPRGSKVPTAYAMTRDIVTRLLADA